MNRTIPSGITTQTEFYGNSKKKSFFVLYVARYTWSVKNIFSGLNKLGTM